MNTPLNNIALLRLMQLVSPALPVGAYAYSQGLEYAVEARWVTNAAQVQSWLLGLLQHNVARVDLPLLKRLYGGWQCGDQESVDYWNSYLCASRESAELQNEDHHLGRALAKLLASLEVEGAAPWQQHATPTFATLFALAAVRWSIPLEQSAMGYLMAWLENQVAAAIKLMPLGQTAGQRILSAGIERIPMAVALGLALDDEEIGFIAPRLVMGSAAHESQYSRLFQS